MHIDLVLFQETGKARLDCRASTANPGWPRDRGYFGGMADDVHGQLRYSASFQIVTTEDFSTLFPFVDLERLLGHPKARKSEDWVNWNVLRAHQLRADWWPAVVSLAKERASALEDSLAFGESPSVDLWRQVPSPQGYERVSRKCMADSNHVDWRNRAANRRPVEGPMEVDVVFDGTEIEKRYFHGNDLRPVAQPDWWLCAVIAGK